jgi:hypothetical protein
LDQKQTSGIHYIAIYLSIAVLSFAAWALSYSPRLAGAFDLVSSSALILWIIAGFVLRYQVSHYYSRREGEPFRIDPLRTFVFSVWYIGGCLRADFPLDEEGEPSKGILKLVD